MRAPLPTQVLDFALKKLILSADVGGKVQAGSVNLVVIPFHEQPRFDSAILKQLGLSEANGQAMVAAVRRAYRAGIIDAGISPITPGCAFDLLQLTHSLKAVRLGTGIVLRTAITRLDVVTAQQWRASGHQSKADFLDHWAQVMPGAPAGAAPWCWLIHFDFKG